MGSDLTESAASLGDPAAQLGVAEDRGEIGSALDPLDIFGVQKAGEIEEAGVASRSRILSFMRSANAMRENVLARIKDRDLQASKAAAGARRAGLLRTGRSSTILSR